MTQTNFMGPWLDFQAKIFGVWQENMNMFMNREDTIERKDPDIFEESMKPFEEMMNKWFNFANDLYTQSIKGFVDANPQQQIIGKMFDGANFYQNLNKFWENLSSNITEKESDPQNFYTAWNEDYLKMVSKQFSSFLPEPIKKIFHESQDICTMSSATTNTFFRPWLDEAQNMQNLLLISMTGDQEAYSEFSRLWQDSFSSSFGKVFSIPQFSMNREQMQKQMYSINALITFINTMNEFSATMLKTNQETYKKIVIDYQDMLISGSNPKTFKEFYQYWLEQNEAAYLKLFSTTEFSKLIAQLLEAGVNFKKSYDNLLEKQLEFLPYPSKTDMDSVYKTLDTLKRDVRALKKELEAQKGEISKTGGKAGNAAKQSAKED